MAIQGTLFKRCRCADPANGREYGRAWPLARELVLRLCDSRSA